MRKIVNVMVKLVINLEDCDDNESAEDLVTEIIDDMDYEFSYSGPDGSEITDSEIIEFDIVG